jgi:hypothetical protein
MALPVSANDSNFEQPEAGMYVARCYSVIDLGTQRNEMYDNTQRQVRIGWEINEMMSDGKQPFSVGAFYTLSLGEKSNLRKVLQGWRGRDFTDAELKNFDLFSILGKPCTLNITKKENGNPKVASVSPLMKGVAPMEPYNELQSFSLFEDFDQEKFSKLSSRMQEKIKLSPEYQKATGQKVEPHNDNNSHEMVPDYEPNDDIVF